MLSTDRFHLKIKTTVKHYPLVDKRCPDKYNSIEDRTTPDQESKYPVLWMIPTSRLRTTERLAESFLEGVTKQLTIHISIIYLVQNLKSSLTNINIFNSRRWTKIVTLTVITGDGFNRLQGRCYSSQHLQCSLIRPLQGLP